MPLVGMPKRFIAHMWPYSWNIKIAKRVTANSKLSMMVQPDRAIATSATFSTLTLLKSLKAMPIITPKRARLLVCIISTSSCGGGVSFRPLQFLL